eukprot:snap_masked-scaffold_14-processed-gene-11.12-mRNA-1 protein AED:1.00 eAED:1.00 QI:0/0/0/0/1/1/2/0/240
MKYSTLSENFVRYLNIVVAASGIVILGVGISSLIELEDYSVIMDDVLLYSPLVLGIFLLFYGFFGYYGIKRNSNGILDEVENLREESLSSSILERISDFILTIFNYCCAEVFDLDVVPSCEEEYTDLCIVNENMFDKTIEQVGNEICDTLSKVSISNTPVVSDPEQGGCGGGSALVFIDIITQYLVNNIKLIGIVYLVIGIILLLNLVATYIFLFKRNKYHNRNENFVQAEVVVASPVHS